MKQQILFILVVNLFLASVGIALAATWTIPNVLMYGVTNSSPSAVAYWAGKHKAYFAFTTSNLDRKGLFVYDTDNYGKLIGAPRRYALLPSKSTNFSTMAYDILINTRDSKLYLGLASYDTGFNTDLGMYSLDTNGEPTGVPQAYATGNPYYYCEQMVLHPKLDRLYCTGFGTTKVHVLNLTTDGTPIDTPTAIDTGGSGNSTVAMNPAATRLYVGAYPGTLWVMNLDASGNLSGTPRSYIDKSSSTEYLKIAVTPEGVYFKNAGGNLAYWDVTPTGEPTGGVVVTTSAIQTRPRAMNDGHLLLVEPIKFTDAITCTRDILSGMAVREYALTTSGAISTLQNETSLSNDAYDRVKATALGSSPNAIVASDYLWGPFGNRFKNVAVRFKLNSMTSTGDIGAACKTKDFSATSDYLKFAYSSRWGRVFSLNPAANNIRTYNIAADTFGTDITATNVGKAIAVDDYRTPLGRLYYARSDGSVDYSDLNPVGVPGAATNISTGMNSIACIGVNAVQHKVYLVGDGGAAGAITGTDLYKLPCSNARGVTVSDRLHKVYAVSMYNGNANIWVWNLNTDGSLKGTAPIAYADGLPLDGVNRGTLYGVAVHPALNKLYVAGSLENAATGTQAYIVVRDLDANGNPTSTTNLIPARCGAGYSSNVALRSDGSWLYYNGAISGVIGVQLQKSTGLPAPNAIHSMWLSNNGYSDDGQLSITSDNLKLLGGSYPWDLTVYDVQPNGTVIPAPNGTFHVGTQYTAVKTLKVGTMTPWINCNAGLTGVGGLCSASLTLAGQITAAQVKMEFSINGGATVAKTATVDTVNNVVSFFAPGYDAKASIAGNVIGALKTSTEQLAAYHALITKPVDTPPTDFLIADLFIYGDGVTASIDTAMDIMQDMGHNTIGAIKGVVEGNAIGSQVHASAINNAQNKFRDGIYSPMSFFDYEENSHNTTSQDSFADTQLKYINESMGSTGSEVGLMHIADEPGWYFPERLTEVEGNEAYKQVFVDYLKTINPSASWFGYTDWILANVTLGRLDNTSTTELRRRWYYTCRFFSQSFAKAAAETTAAMTRRMNPSVLTAVNLNNWPNRWFTPHPGMLLYNNVDKGLSACSASPDWFDMGRQNAVTCMWTEDWIKDCDAQLWSFYADMLRCAARTSTNNMKFGGYLVVGPTGEIPSGGQYRILSLFGHGAKAADSWMFGPNAFLTENGYSDSTLPVMQSMADGFDLLGQKQSVLYPGAPRTGTVAVHISTASQAWDGEPEIKYYLQEVFGLHAALIHANFPVDFVDDTDIENGQLATYGYKALYITGPNLSTTAQTAINSWVNSGGTCVLMPGAGCSDEFNDSIAILQSRLGCTQSKLPRVKSPITNWQAEAKHTISILSDYQTTLGAVSADVYGQTCPLTVTTGTEMATITGGSAIVLNPYGAGRYITYGFWPGNQYWNGADRINRLAMPVGYDSSLRALITAPAGANYGGAQKFASSSVAMVETALLENVTSGIGITLLNWSEGPVSSTTISVNKMAMPMDILNAVNAAIAGGTLVANSAKSGDLTYTVVGNNIIITLPVANVDVLTLTW